MEELKEVFITQNCEQTICGCFTSLEGISEHYSHIKEANLDNLQSREYEYNESVGICWDLFITKIKVNNGRNR